MIGLSCMATSGRRPSECSEHRLNVAGVLLDLLLLLPLLRVAVAAMVLGAEAEAKPTFRFLIYLPPLPTFLQTFFL